MLDYHQGLQISTLTDVSLGFILLQLNGSDGSELNLHIFMSVCVKCMPIWMSLPVQRCTEGTWHLCVQGCVDEAD